MTPKQIRQVEKIRLETPLSYEQAYSFVESPTLEEAMYYAIYLGIDLTKYIELPKEQGDE